MTVAALHAPGDFGMTLQDGLSDDQRPEKFTLLLQVVFCLSFGATCSKIPRKQGVPLLVEISFCQQESDFLRRFRHGEDPEFVAARGPANKITFIQREDGHELISQFMQLL